MTALLVILALFATPVSATDCPTGTQRSRDVVVTPADLALNILDSTGFTFFHGCTATNYQRWQLDEALVWSMTDVFAFADAMGIDVHKRLLAYAGPMPRYKGPTRTVFQFDHGPFYWDICGEHWCALADRRASQQKPFCRHYGLEQYLMRDTQAGALRQATRCAALLTPTVGTLLNLKVVDGACVLDKTPPPAPQEGYKSARAMLGITNGECRGPLNPATHRCRTIPQPLSPEMIAALDAMHAAHACVSDNKCLPPGTPPKACPSHFAAAEKVKALAPDEETLNLVTMSFFSGKTDPRASAADICTAFRIADDAHAAWHECVLDGDAACADRARALHQEAHIWIAYMNPLLTLRYFSEPSDLTLSGLLGPHARHPNLTARQLFDEYRAARPAHLAELARMVDG